MKRWALLLVFLLPAVVTRAQLNELLSKPDEWYRSAEALLIADNILLFQRYDGGWPKEWPLGKNYLKNYTQEERTRVYQQKNLRDCTFDNGATWSELRFLGRICKANNDASYRLAFNWGLDFVLEAQYPNGGWPQFYPGLQRYSPGYSKWNPEGIESLITFNDHAMARVIWLLKDVAEDNKAFGFVNEARREKAAGAVARGIGCILRSQIAYDGRLTGWPAQVDPVTFEPRWGRDFEPASIAAQESVTIVRFLMSIDQPSPAVVAAIQGAVSWLDQVRIRGLRIVKDEKVFTMAGKERRDIHIRHDPEAPPVWARFYELNSFRPVFGDRGDSVKYKLSELSLERRTGYGWYGTWPQKLLSDDYPEWRRKHGVEDVLLSPPYPPSKVIRGVRFAPETTVIRMAEGGDNWPVTWADDGNLYTAYGDGQGFKPQVEEKLGLGLALVKGFPPEIEGVNIRSSAENKGYGRNGKKASGMLMVDGVLYMWLFHADEQGGEAQLAWSEDHGKTWTFGDWRFKEFGLCNFINYGRNYEGARDNYVYTVSHDGPRADGPADRMILMRVPKDKIADRSAYEFFRGMNGNSPEWTADIDKRGAVFEHEDACLRSGISYDPGLKRYLWWQHLPNEPGHKDRGDTRFSGGFGIYEAPEPWGPWKTVYFTRQWDMGPGERAEFPTKWMSEDGKTCYLVFSGEDCFSVRKVVFETE